MPQSKCPLAYSLVTTDQISKPCISAPPSVLCPHDYAQCPILQARWTVTEAQEPAHTKQQVSRIELSDNPALVRPAWLLTLVGLEESLVVALEELEDMLDGRNGTVPSKSEAIISGRKPCGNILPLQCSQGCRTWPHACLSFWERP